MSVRINTKNEALVRTEILISGRYDLSVYETVVENLTALDFREHSYTSGYVTPSNMAKPGGKPAHYS